MIVEVEELAPDILGGVGGVVVVLWGDGVVVLGMGLRIERRGGGIGWASSNSSNCE